MKKNSDRTVLGEGRFLRLVRENGWEYVEQSSAGGVVAILAVTVADEVLLVEQVRPPVGARVIELPAGMVGDHEAAPGEDAQRAARRELVEETGYEAGAMQSIGSGPSSAGITREIVQFFFAGGVRKVAPGGGVGSEEIQVHAVARAGLRSWLARRREEGCMIDLRVFSALEMAAMERVFQQ